jgi:hypothetical protein
MALFKFGGVLGKIVDAIVKVARVIIQGREAGLWDRQAGPNIKPKVQGLFAVSPSDQPVTLEGIAIVKPAYNAWTSVEKGLKQAGAMAIYGIGAAAVGWLMNPASVEAFMAHAGMPEAFLGIAVLVCRAIGAFVVNLLKTFDPETDLAPKA